MPDFRILLPGHVKVVIASVNHFHRLLSRVIVRHSGKYGTSFNVNVPNITIWGKDCADASRVMHYIFAAGGLKLSNRVL